MEDGRHRKTRTSDNGSAGQAAVAGGLAAAARAHHTAALQAAYQNAGPGQVITFHGNTFISASSDLEFEIITAEHEGIQLGEIEAWRVWRVKDNGLWSVTNDTFWPPSTHLEAHKVDIPLGDGIHAFRTEERARFYWEAGYAGPMPVESVWGQLLLWGEIVEFEEGYHAQYAKVSKIVDGVGCDLDALRERYGV
jgi:hypothetical protein